VEWEPKISISGSKLRDVILIRLFPFILEIFQQKNLYSNIILNFKWKSQVSFSINERISEGEGYLFLCQESPLTTICFFYDFYHLSSIYSDELVIFLSFFFSKNVYVHRFCVDVAMPLLCAALFFLYFVFVLA